MPADLSDILESTEATRLATGCGHTEGPLWHPAGYLTFVNIRDSQLLKYDPSNGQVTVVRSNTGEGNGCTFDLQGRLIMCEGADHRRVTRLEPDGSITTIASRWQGRRFNKPNDVICRRSDGSIYFTDPELRLPPEQREMGFAGVFRIGPDGGVYLATNQCVYPNGLALSPDESVMYVAISRAEPADLEREAKGEFCPNRRILAFDVAPDGLLNNMREFADMSSSEPGVPDGMKVDSLGRVFCVGSGGIWVFEPDGTRIGVIRPPEVPRNIAFGGPDFRTLYMTPGSSLYSMQVKTPGIPPY